VSKCCDQVGYQMLTFEREDKIAVIGLNRPSKMNALNTELLIEMERLLEGIAQNGDIYVVVVKGSEKFFAAGGDLGEMNQFKAVMEGFRYGSDVQRVFKKLSELPQATIAAVSGIAFGGGCELSLACDIRIAGENAKFGLPEITVGVLPGGGGTQRLPRLIGVGRAKEMLFLGEPIDASEAYRIGLVNRVVPTQQVLEEAMSMARKLAQRPRFGLQTIKKLVNEGMNMDLSSALSYETRCFGSLFGTEDQKEGVSAFMEKRKPAFKGK
jgi:enoyl-CoA hydratase